MMYLNKYLGKVSFYHLQMLTLNKMKLNNNLFHFGYNIKQSHSSAVIDVKLYELTTANLFMVFFNCSLAIHNKDNIFTGVYFLATRHNFNQ